MSTSMIDDIDLLFTELKMEQSPSKMKYRPGEEISFDGAKFTFGGQDVTSDVFLDVIEGTPWRAYDKEVNVKASYDGSVVEFRLTRKRKIWPFAILAVVLCAAIAGVVWWQTQPQPDTGSYIIPQGDMTDEEAQAMLDEQAEKSRITVSLSPNPTLKDDGQLRVNFIVVEPNNGYSERLEIEQDGAIIYRSGVVEPGHKIEWGQSVNAHVGGAVATVYAVDDDDLDHGNPISVESEII